MRSQLGGCCQIKSLVCLSLAVVLGLVMLFTSFGTNSSVLATNFSDDVSSFSRSGLIAPEPTLAKSNKQTTTQDSEVIPVLNWQETRGRGTRPAF